MENNSDQKLASRIGKLQAVSLVFKRLTLISVAAIVLGIIAEIMDSPQALPVLLSASATFIVSLAAQKVISRKIKELTSGDFIADILRETFQDCEYQYNVSVAGWRVEKSQLVADWNEISGGDHVTGKYRGCLIEFSDIMLKNAYETYNSDGARTTERAIVFSGQWIVCELGCELAEPVYLWENEYSDSREVPPGWLERNGYIETANPAFNNRFTIESADPHAPFRVLTPYFMEYLLRTSDGRVRRYIKFHGKHMQFALHSGLDMFEVKGDVRTAEDIDRLRTGIKSEVENITGILDQIMLNEYLFPPAPSPALPPAQ